MTVKQVERHAPKLFGVAAHFYAHLVRELPWGMMVLHLRNPEGESTWDLVAANRRAKSLLGGSFHKHLRIPKASRDELPDQPIELAGLIRGALDQGRAKPLGYVVERANLQRPEIYSAHALPLEENCVAIVLHDVSRDARAKRDQTGAEARLDEICRSARAILWTADAATLEFRCVTSGARSILGYWAERWYREPNFWRKHAHPDDWELIESHCARTA